MSAVKKGLLVAAVGAILLFLILVLNQMMSLYRNLSSVDEILAVAATTIVAGVFLVIFLLPVYAFLRYPKLPYLPESMEDEKYQACIDALLVRLKTNKALKGLSYDFDGATSLEKVQNAYAILKSISDKQIKKEANAVFLTTAISQNGVLDGATVLVTLAKMVYGITRLYESRPTFMRMIYLYGQIASVVLIARTMEDLDLIEEQMEPVLTSLLGGSVVSLVPGAMGVTTLVVNSIVQGSVNALLTLRVGVIAQRYLSATVQVDKKTLRRGAAKEAAGHLGAIIGENAKFVVKSITLATKKVTVDKIKWPWVKESETL